MTRKLTFEQAKRLYGQRYTLDHVPNWAFKHHNGRFYAPQYASDREWYENTLFPGEDGHHGFGKDCYSSRATYPLGVWLDKPYRGRAGYVSGDDEGMPLDVREALVMSRAQDDFEFHA
ncbi:hypothetical protein [Methylobacterium sp. WL120]|uniref:hypothetical protein n=1 Tax=Methylobacterium sp. WL120 TaxID=2603887 RepID=UPI0011CAFFA3|nr:hypothetical protein [Methylobacterium sp. WL120]TXM69663.1 hypothetical protein FV229_04780 [Methylobacterium sp. WL120]